jgi:hypothetical protein
VTTAAVVMTADPDVADVVFVVVEEVGSSDL